MGFWQHRAVRIMMELDDGWAEKLIIDYLGFMKNCRKSVLWKSVFFLIYQKKNRLPQHRFSAIFRKA